jgi:N-acetyl-gamma-glutamylphosphate reductase
MPEMAKTIERLSGGSAAGLVFTPHLVPMTRGVLATMYCRGRATPAGRQSAGIVMGVTGRFVQNRTLSRL